MVDSLGTRSGDNTVFTNMTKFFLWVVLLVICWPVAILALVLYPVVWLLLLPFRLLGIVVEGVFAFIRSVIFLPARVLGR